MTDPTPREGLAVRGSVSRGRAELHLDLRVTPGEVLAVVGPNGAGKSTTLHVVAGLVPLDAGAITCDDEIWQDDSHLLAPESRNCGVVFQDVRLFPTMSVLANVAFGCRARGDSRAHAADRAREVLRDVGAEHLADRSPAALSGGERQRVALARALAPRPRVLLLDEPFASVDAASRPALREVIAAAIAEFSGSVVVVSHDPADVERLADDVMHL